MDIKGFLGEKISLKIPFNTTFERTTSSERRNRYLLFSMGDSKGKPHRKRTWVYLYHHDK
ncbi:hypothetical protein [Xenorhabdus bovienii]|uniref:hypothetical protein n=1 Tax=Xenorhabdus bovienii TaxID=40576 RepID=UPI000A82B6C3|nr:hypothetical protein [Xenorhabdus bovienii]